MGEETPPRWAVWVGRALRGVFRAVLAVRHPRPIHPRGVVLTGHITWREQRMLSGLSWIDSPASRRVAVTARLSRSLGLPGALPDVIGLALRVGTDEGTADAGPADIELASTGAGVPGRFLLVPHRSPARARYGTIFPYRSARGPVLLGARPIARGIGRRAFAADLSRGPWRVRLYFATAAGPWHPFADVELRRAADQRDASLRFDAVRRPLPGASTYGWVAALRQPSYGLAQAS